MSKHNYTNPAFCQSSEFYPTPKAIQTESYPSVEGIYNRSLNGNFIANGVRLAGRTNNGPLRIQRSMSTRSIRSKTSHKTPSVHQQQRQQYENSTTQPQLCRTVEAFETRSSSGRYALVPVEELAKTTTGTNSRYAIVPGQPLANTKRFTKSQDELDCYGSRPRLASDDEPHSYHEELSEQFTSLPPIFNNDKRQQQLPAPAPKIKHAFSSDFGSKSFLIVDKNSNQRYQMVPTAEDEEIVDDNQEIIQMHNGRPHRYAVIPTEDVCDDEDEMEEETCLSTSDLHKSHNFLTQNFVSERTPLRTSTPQKGVSMGNLAASSYPSTPLKYPNPAATKMLHELLSTPRKATSTMRSVQTTPRRVVARERLQQQQRGTNYHHHQSVQQIYFTPTERKKELSPQRLHYETIKPITSIHSNTQPDRTMAVITPRVASGAKVHPHVIEEEDCSSIHAKSFNNSSYTQKVANAAITLAIVSLMLVLGSAMNSGLIIYMIMHFGKSFYLQFSLGAAFCGVGLGILGFRARHCEWLPNRSYTSGYILVTVFCLLKCCGLLVILVLDPYPGLPLHDVTTGIILGLSTFSLFFIGLGVIGSLWCYRPPPDNRVNVV